MESFLVDLIRYHLERQHLSGLLPLPDPYGPLLLHLVSSENVGQQDTFLWMEDPVDSVLLRIRIVTHALGMLKCWGTHRVDQIAGLIAEERPFVEAWIWYPWFLQSSEPMLFGHQWDFGQKSSQADGLWGNLWSYPTYPGLGHYGLKKEQLLNKKFILTIFPTSILATNKSCAEFLSGSFHLSFHLSRVSLRTNRCQGT